MVSLCYVMLCYVKMLRFVLFFISFRLYVCLFVSFSFLYFFVISLERHHLIRAKPEAVVICMVIENKEFF